MNDPSVSFSPEVGGEEGVWEVPSMTMFFHDYGFFFFYWLREKRERERRKNKSALEKHAFGRLLCRLKAGLEEVGRRGKDHLQQRQRDIALQARLQLDLDIQVQAQLQPHRLGVGQAGEHGGVGQAAGLGELLVVAPAPAATRVDGRGIRGGVVKLFAGKKGFQSEL